MKVEHDRFTRRKMLPESPVAPKDRAYFLTNDGLPESLSLSLALTGSVLPMTKLIVDLTTLT
ncbi:hypothetical protein WCLP8_10005 [uncultured Gammaproteobacteria bacterium]